MLYVRKLPAAHATTAPAVVEDWPMAAGARLVARRWRRPLEAHAPKQAPRRFAGQLLKVADGSSSTLV